MNDHKLGITISLKGDGDVKRAVVSLEQLGASGKRAAQQINTGFSAARRGVQSISEQLERTKSQMLAFFSIQYAAQMSRQLASVADIYTNLNSRLKLVSGTTQELARAQAASFDIAQRYNMALDDTGRLYTRLAPIAQNLGRSQADLITLMTGVGAAMKVSGATAAEAGSTITQLTQSLAAATVQGADFNLLYDTAPAIVRAVEKELSGLVRQYGSLKNAMEKGAVSNEQLFDVLVKTSAEFQRQAATMSPTVSGAVQNLSNAWTDYVGRADQANGSSRRLADTLQDIARNFDAIVDPAARAVAAILRVEVGGWLTLQEIIRDTLTNLREMAGIQTPGAAPDAETQRLMRMGRGQMSIEEIAGPPPGAQPPQQPYFDGQRRGAPATPPGAAGSGRSGRGHDTPYDATFTAAETQYRLPPGLLKAVADVESSFNPRAISPAGAKGLMQFMPGTASRFGLRDPFNAEASIQAAGKYFRTLLDLFKGDLVKAIAAYNAGEGNVQKLGIDKVLSPGFAKGQTRAYVPKVLGKLENYGNNVGLQDQFERERDAAQEREKLAEETTRFETTQREASVEAAARADALTTARLEAAYQNRELSAREYYAQLDQLQRAATDRETAELTRQVGVERAAQATRTQGTLEYVQGQEAIFALEQKIAQIRDQAAQTAQANQIALTAATREQNQALAEQLHQVKVRLLELAAEGGPKLADMVIPPEQRELFNARLQVLEDQYRDFIERLRQAGDTAGLLQIRELITAEAMRDVKAKTDQVTEFGIQAARNIQSAFANFLFDPFKDGLKGMARSFLETIRRMASEAAAASIMRGVLGPNFEKGELGGWLGGIIGAVRGDRPATPYPKGSVPDNQQVGPPAPPSVGQAAGAVVAVDETTFEGVLGSFKTGFEQIFNGDFFKGLGSIFEGGFGGIVSMLGDLIGGLFGGGSGGSGGAGSMVAEGVGTALEVIGSFFHAGGLVGAGGVTRALPALAFAGAPRYHTGGLAGLKPNEVPAVLMGGPKGTREEVLTANDPRHRDNLPFDSAQGTGRGGQARPAAAASMESTVNVVNVLDPSLLGQFLSTKGGEKLVMNVLSRNSGALQKMVSRG